MLSNIAKPLTWLTHIEQKFIWDEPQEQAFQELKAIFFINPHFEATHLRTTFPITHSLEYFKVESHAYPI